MEGSFWKFVFLPQTGNLIYIYVAVRWFLPHTGGVFSWCFTPGGIVISGINYWIASWIECIDNRHRVAEESPGYNGPPDFWPFIGLKAPRPW